ncbi:uncharacterized protein LOC128820273 [Vidua macroura]|uniref:uncharacterized protein LOC128820273 n=1 Tax=Vidua macroura TaxID=187451 RepID=UPI0023A7F1C8|nr:uncharacterized protein LOC128820273 [Vidua macroura]
MTTSVDLMGDVTRPTRLSREEQGLGMTQQQLVMPQLGFKAWNCPCPWPHHLAPSHLSWHRHKAKRCKFGCFPSLFQIYHYLRRKCSRRNRGYSREISLSHRRFCSGAFANRHGRASFSYDGEGSVTYSRRPSSCLPLPAPAPYSISGGYSCDTGGDCGVTSSWDLTVGTVPVYGSGVGMGYSSEDVGPVYHGGNSGMAEGAGAGYEYSAPLSDTLCTGGVSEGSGYYGGGYGYGTHGSGTFPGPELSPAGGGCAQVVQQKCPVVVPTIKTQQCKQSTHWPPIQKK